MNPAIVPVFLRPEEAAKVLGVSRATVYRLLNEGAIPSTKIGHLRRIPRVALDTWATDVATGGDAA